MAFRLLFVCLGNICRSPSAENIMNHLIQQAGLQEHILCDSAGTSSYHIGSSPDRRMTAAAQVRGITLRGQARQFQITDFQEFDLILAMDKENYRDIISLDRQKRHTHKVLMICEFASKHRDRSVPDPYYGGSAGFDHVINLLLDACNGLLQQIIREQQLPPSSDI